MRMMRTTAAAGTEAEQEQEQEQHFQELQLGAARVQTIEISIPVRSLAPISRPVVRPTPPQPSVPTAPRPILGPARPDQPLAAHHLLMKCERQINMRCRILWLATQRKSCNRSGNTSCIYSEVYNLCLDCTIFNVWFLLLIAHTHVSRCKYASVLLKVEYSTQNTGRVHVLGVEWPAWPLNDECRTASAARSLSWVSSRASSICRPRARTPPHPTPVWHHNSGTAVHHCTSKVRYCTEFAHTAPNLHFQTASPL